PTRVLMDLSWGGKPLAEGSSPRGLRLLAILFCQILLASPAGDAAAQTPAPETEAIRALIVRGSVPELRPADFAEVRQALDDSYRPGGYAALWLAPGTAAPILAELKDAPSHGLDPKDYDVAWLEGEVNAIAAGDRTPGRTARADVALTVSFFRLLSDLHDGRVSPEKAGFKLDGPSKPTDLPAILLNGKQSDLWHEALLAVEPQFVLYRRLEAELGLYRTLASQPVPALPPIPAGKSKIAPGDTYAGIGALSERLRL